MTPVARTKRARGPEPDAAPRRRCFVTRRTADKAALVRFVVDPEGRVVPDVAGRLPGRGLWLSATRDVVNTAVAKGLFAKGFRAPVTVGDGLADEVERLLARRCLDLIGLARRAGRLDVGAEKVRAALAAGKAGALVVAADAGADARRLIAAAGALPVVACFSAAELGAALGRARAVYLALRKGRQAAQFVVEARRLDGFRPTGGASFAASPEGKER